MAIDVRTTVTEVGYIAVGVGVLAVQQVHSRARELQQRLDAVSPVRRPAQHAQDARTALKARVDDAARRAASFGADVRGRLEPMAEQLEARLGELPSPFNRAAEPVQRARELLVA